MSTVTRRSFVSVVAGATVTAAADRRVMTVRGAIPASDVGLTLTHEHILASFQSYEEREKNPLRYDIEEVVSVVRPLMEEIKKHGCRTFVDATATGLGRDPRLLKRVSEDTGLNIVMATGNYAAMDAKFLPRYVYTDSVEQLAKRWIDEARRGIDGSGVRPGFIKLGFNGGRLTEAEQKLIRAAAITHRETGLTIAAHTGPAVSAFEQLAILKTARVDPSAWIWIHAQNEKDPAMHVKAAREGAWVSFDGVKPGAAPAYVAMVSKLRDEGLLGRVLVSQDAGWYHVGEPRGGSIRPFSTVFTEFIPAARAAGFTKAEIDRVFVVNPADAFGIGVRRG